MIEFTVEDICLACGGYLVCDEPSTRKKLFGRKITKLTTDTREVNEDCEMNGGLAFLALKGERFDGNDFTEEMCKKNVAAVICSLSEDNAKKAILACGEMCGTAVITVKDTLKALGDIAAKHRDCFDIPVVAITGSVGKTSTKEMTAAVLSQKFNVLKTKANFNNEIGLPKTLLELTECHEAAVTEMGMRGLNQIDYLCNTAKPSVGIITNIGVSHLELLGSRENIFRAKLEIASNRSCKRLILNGDDDMLSDRTSVLSVLKEYGNVPELIYYGTDECCDYRAENIQSTDEGTAFTLVTPLGSCVTELSMIGRHHIYNALAAAAAGELLGLSLREIDAGIRNAGKGEIIRQKIEQLENGITVIDDTYNAGPESMKASLLVLRDAASKKKGRRVAVLGDMLELGKAAEKAHYDVGAFAAECGTDLLLTVGELTQHTARGYSENADSDGFYEVLSFENSEEAARSLGGLIKNGDTVLVKGSHAMEMPKVVAALKNI